MRFPGRARSASVEVTPRELLPTQELEAVLAFPEPVSGVSSATLELGYFNTYTYQWAGRRDAAARYDDLSLATIDQVGTSYGSNRSTEDWVSVSSEDIPVAGGVLEGGEQRLRLRVPSWAPGSSEELIRWAVRLTVVRAKGRDVAADGEFSVRVPEPAEAPVQAGAERVAGDSCDIDIRFEQECWMAGETVRGTVVMTPRSEVPEADVAVLLQRRRVSHPLERSPAPDYEWDGDAVTLDKHLKLTSGVATELGFEIELPDDAAPTAEAVHASLSWAVLVRVMYKGFNAHMPERVRREFVVYNARRGA